MHRRKLTRKQPILGGWVQSTHSGVICCRFEEPSKITVSASGHNASTCVSGVIVTRARHGAFCESHLLGNLYTENTKSLVASLKTQVALLHRRPNS